MVPRATLGVIVRVLASQAPRAPDPGSGASAALARPVGPVVAVTAAAGALLAAAYVAFLASLDGVPLEDLPAHLARAVAASDILFHGGARFGDIFAFRAAPVPYALGDLVLAVLVALLGPYRAGAVWAALVMASLPAAVATYLAVRRYPPFAIAIGAVAALYLGTDWSFMLGFHAYRLAVALTLVALAGWQRFLERGEARWFALYAAALAAGYMVHLSALLFCAVGAGATGLYALVSRRAGFWRVACGVAPLAAVLAWNTVFSGGGVPAAAPHWDPPFVKLKRLLLPFHRYGYAVEGALCALYAGVHALLLRGARAGWRGERAVEPLLLAAAFVAVYALLPFSQGYIAWIDIRAVPYAILFVLFAALGAAGERPRHARAVAALACALAAGNLLLLRAHLAPENEVMRAYREIAARVPRGALVLSVATRPQDESTNPYLHAGAFATIEAAARNPHLFVGGVTPYFTWRVPRPTAPSDLWYQQRYPVEAELAATVPGYEYILAMKPYDAARMPPIETHAVAENDVALLLRVVHGGARAGPGDRRAR